jgi:hypothetical protein
LTTDSAESNGREILLHEDLDVVVSASVKEKISFLYEDLEEIKDQTEEGVDRKVKFDLRSEQLHNFLRLKIFFQEEVNVMFEFNGRDLGE